MQKIRLEKLTNILETLQFYNADRTMQEILNILGGNGYFYSRDSLKRLLCILIKNGLVSKTEHTFTSTRSPYSKYTKNLYAVTPKGTLPRNQIMLENILLNRAPIIQEKLGAEIPTEMLLIFSLLIPRRK